MGKNNNPVYISDGIICSNGAQTKQIQTNKKVEDTCWICLKWVRPSFNRKQFRISFWQNWEFNIPLVE